MNGVELKELLLFSFAEIRSKTSGGIEKHKAIRSSAKFKLQRQIRPFDWTRFSH